VTTWAEANGVSMLAAAQAHGDYGIDTATWPVDVYGAIYTADVMTIWRQMPKQFGAYINDPGSRSGVMINNGLPHAAQRQTAGARTRAPLVEARNNKGRRPGPSRRPKATVATGGELAESFASWFLMPRKAAVAALDRLDIKQLRSPADAYLLSLLLGTPYRATVRHLPNIRLVSRVRAAEWIRVPRT